MPERTQMPVKLLHELSGAHSEGTLIVDRFAAGERRKRAVLALLGAWTLGALTIAIPIVHFVAPFVLFAAGIWLAVRFWKEHARMRELAGTCPKCGNNFTKEMEGAPDLPVWSECPHCGASLAVHARDET